MTSPLLQALNPAQQQAVQAIDGPVLVLAGPGSGKTRLLTHRVAYLIDEIGVDPFHILAVTFTNRAAREMKERLDVLLGPGRAAALTVGTFHGLCARFLRRDIVHLGRESDFAIYDADDQERLMKRVLKELRLDEKKHPPRAIRGTISSAKNELQSVQDFAQRNASYYDEIVARCYERYQTLLRESNALDFDDLLFTTVRLFELHPEVLAHYHTRYRYLLVDEYQDTNRAQYVLVHLLASHQRNLFVVGDEDQSIFQWRGADVRNILQFEEDYPDAQVFLLEQNYRSTQTILDIAQSVINASTGRKHKKQLWTNNDSGIQVALIEGYDQDEEAQWVADEIARLVARDGYALRDCAVMYRTNAQSRALEEALIGRSLRYQIVGGTRFYERKEIKDLVAYLRVLHNPADSVSLERIINTPPRSIGQKTVLDLQRWAADLGVPLYQALLELASDDPHSATAPFSARPRKALLGFLEMLNGLLAQSQQADLHSLLDALLERLHFHEALKQEYGSDEADERWNNVQELYSIAADYVNLPPETQLPTLLEEIALVSDTDRMDQQADTVTCITLHQAKGLEFRVVFLIGLEEGLLPHSRSLGDKDKLDEERRLLYVGATRAQERLYMLYAFRRTVYGSSNISTPSRFLADIPQGMLQRAQQRPRANVAQSRMFSQRGSLGGSSGRTSSSSSGGRSAARTGRTAAAQGSASFFPGQRVQHNTFGEGIVVSSRLVDGDEEVVVNFGKKGEKKLLASFARLRRLG